MPSCSTHPLPYQVDPAVYFERLGDAPGAVLLDAGRPGADRGRFDLLSAWPLQRFTTEADESGTAFFQRLRQALADLGPCQAPAGRQLPFVGGLIGYLGYDFGRRLERLPAQATDDLGLPDAGFGLYSWALVSDHLLGTSELVFHPRTSQAERQRLIRLFEADAPCPMGDFHLHEPFRAELGREQYRAAIERIQSYIAAGDCYQVNFAQRFQAPCQGDPWAAYRQLRSACPTPFAAYQRLADGSALLSLSPERFIQVSQRQVETRPIKGTRPRATSTVSAMTSRCSSWSSVATSPVVPHGTRPDEPSAICHSTRSRNAA